MDSDDSDATGEHERFMQRCIELAYVAKSRGNTPVGSLVVIDGKIVGEGIDELPAGNSVTGHAETLACQSAVHHTGSKLLDGARLYTAAEPCFMCSYVIRQCGISLVVYGLDTPIVGGISSSMPILVDASLSDWLPPPRVLGGVLRDECRKLKQTNHKQRGNNV